MSGTEQRCAREVTTAGVAVPLRVDRVTGGPGQPADTLHCTDIEGTNVRVSADRSLVPDSTWETDGWYRFGDIRRSGTPGIELAAPSGSAVERIDAPEQRAHPPLTDLDDPWLLQFGASTERVAVTVQPRPTDTVEAISADDPESFEIGAVCFAYGDGTDTAVYHREEPDPEDERLLLEHVVDDLTAAEGATLLTGGADRAPLELLDTRLEAAVDGDGAARALDGCFHADLDRVTDSTEVDSLGAVAQIEHSPVRLDSYDIGVEPTAWRADWDIDTTALETVSDPRMTDRDYAHLVELHLGETDESVASSALSQCLKAYASAELSLLCALGEADAVDRLGCPRLGARAFEQR
ncbi:MAG: hypothetical protein J07HX64_00241 [halophilic archaeon J07HX64]|jgi:hypothetical protein|nr:MAG: hypothetical protein J07HX64_00241 [halophilic archaeon J07HX64]